MDPLNEISIEPNIVKSVAKAMELTGVQSSVANTSNNTNATVATLTDIKGQNTQIISLLQQLVDK